MTDIAATLRDPVRLAELERSAAPIALDTHWQLRVTRLDPGECTAFVVRRGFRILRGHIVETLLVVRDRAWRQGDVVERGLDDVAQLTGAGTEPAVVLEIVARAFVAVPEEPPCVIVGGGFSGAAMAYHLLRTTTAPITIVERGPWLGRGIAYGCESEAFQLNVSAGRMSLDPDHPDDFATWANVDRAAFLPRVRYGEYVVARLAHALRSHPARLRRVRGEVVAVEPTSVRLADGKAIPARAVVIATGLSPRSRPSVLPSDPRIIDGWDEEAMSALPRDGKILVLGSGLSMLDLLAFSERRGFVGTWFVISHRGLVPRRHVPQGTFELSRAAIDRAPHDLRQLVRWARAAIASAVREGGAWQHGVDALRPHTTELWRRLSAADRARFVRRIKPYWDVLRHRAPAESLELVATLQRHGRLLLSAGKVVACDPAKRLEVVIRDRDGNHHHNGFDAIVRCIGPALESSQTDTGLFHDLIARGEAVVDPAGLGIVTDLEGRLVTATGSSSSRVFALGAIRRASSWETGSVPDIVRHAKSVAALLARSK